MTPKRTFYTQPADKPHDGGFSKEYLDFVIDAPIKDVDGWVEFVMYQLGFGM